MSAINEPIIVTCPKCDHEFDANDMISHRLVHVLDGQRKVLQKEFDEKEVQLRKFQAKLKQQKHEIDVAVQEQLNQKEKELRRELKSKLEKENELEIQELRKELELKQQKINENKQLEIELERERRKGEEVKKDLELQYERRLSVEAGKIEEKLNDKIAAQFEMKLAEKEKIMEDLKKQLAETQRKAAQGSMQLQGEVQERAIEDYLRLTYPLDEIREVPKGVSGGDCIHVIYNDYRREAGSILIESKRTKSFSLGWIQKLKDDQLKSKAELALLVTEMMPEENQKLVLIDGVWVCDFATFKWVINVLREQVLSVDVILHSQKNKGDKMSQLYSYLTGSEFKAQIMAIVESFENLMALETKERAAMERIWKERMKNLERVHVNTNNFIGSIKGIAGNTLPGLDLIESE